MPMRTKRTGIYWHVFWFQFMPIRTINFTDIAIAGHRYGPCCASLRLACQREALILIEPFRLVIVSNHFEGLLNTLQFELQGLDFT